MSTKNQEGEGDETGSMAGNSEQDWEIFDVLCNQVSRVWNDCHTINRPKEKNKYSLENKMCHIKILYFTLINMQYCPHKRKYCRH